MKLKKPILLLLLITLIEMTSCAKPDPCDVRHVIIDGECIPEYIFPNNQNLKSGNKFYHSDFGIITYKDSLWYDADGILVKELNTNIK